MSDYIHKQAAKNDNNGNTNDTHSLSRFVNGKTSCNGKVGRLKVDDNGNITILFKCKLMNCIVKVVALRALQTVCVECENVFPFNSAIVCVFYFQEEIQHIANTNFESRIFCFTCDVKLT